MSKSLVAHQHNRDAATELLDVPQAVGHTAPQEVGPERTQTVTRHQLQAAWAQARMLSPPCHT